MKNFIKWIKVLLFTVVWGSMFLYSVSGGMEYRYEWASFVVPSMFIVSGVIFIKGILTR